MMQETWITDSGKDVRGYWVTRITDASGSCSCPHSRSNGDFAFCTLVPYERLYYFHGETKWYRKEKGEFHITRFLKIPESAGEIQPE
jgi:hypothetical protein